MNYLTLATFFPRKIKDSLVKYNFKIKEEVSSMTVEQAFYFKIMLICGYSDELFEYIENTLNEQTSYFGRLCNADF